MDKQEGEFDYSQVPEYNERSFWKYIKKMARSMGATVMVPAFTLFYAFQDSNTPKWAKAVIGGALAYLVLPADAIPDVIPIVGWSDDIGALAAASAAVVAYITPAHKQQANEQVVTLLGPAPDKPA